MTGINRVRLRAACVLLLITANLHAQLAFHPPRIIVSDQAMELMLIDGPPANVPIAGTGLEFVVNTDWSVFRDTRNETWYLLRDGSWSRNNMLSSGDWISTQELPDDFLTLQVSSDWPSVAAAMPPRKPEKPALPLVISYEPTELVLTDGEPKLEPVGDDGLQYVSNTKNDLFFYNGRYYILLSGRWFSTKSFKRQWAFVKTPPPVFAGIPEKHPRARVLASVPGTLQAERAVAEAMKPKVAVVRADAGRNEVPYAGEPSFVPIEGTVLRRAENTPFQVIMHNNFYYLCYEGAWYASSNPRGPWQAATEVPEAIYTIPATDPAYNVTFVRLKSFDDSSGEIAYVNTGGYYSAYYTGSTIVYGTGWYYPGYYNRGHYWRYPHTYGYRPYWGGYYPYGYGYSHSETYRINREETDWEWDLDGSKRRVYRYGPRNTIGSGEYVMPESDNYKGDGKR